MARNLAERRRETEDILLKISQHRQKMELTALKISEFETTCTEEERGRAEMDASLRESLRELDERESHRLDQSLQLLTTHLQWKNEQHRI